MKKEFSVSSSTYKSTYIWIIIKPHYPACKYLLVNKIHKMFNKMKSWLVIVVSRDWAQWKYQFITANSEMKVLDIQWQCMNITCKLFYHKDFTHLHLIIMKLTSCACSFLCEKTWIDCTLKSIHTQLWNKVYAVL